MVAAIGRRKLGAAARRESILAAAIPAFMRAGYERTRVADIATKVGVTEPVVFQNFGTKAGLFAAVLDRAADEVITYVTLLAERSANAAEFLSALLAHDHQDRMHTSGGLGMIFSEAGTNSEPLFRKAARRAHTRTLHAVAELLRRGQAEGSIRDDVGAVTLACLVISQIHARQFRRAHSETSATLENAMLGALLAAIRPVRRGVRTANHQGIR
jgi:AcrR family transcriptional regulator